jgi:hypothetical protein
MYFRYGVKKSSADMTIMPVRKVTFIACKH